MEFLKAYSTEILFWLCQNKTSKNSSTHSKKSNSTDEIKYINISKNDCTYALQRPN